MSRQCPNCRKITKAVLCEGCGYSLEASARGRRGFGETCFRIGVAITIAASVTAFIAKLIF